MGELITDIILYITLIVYIIGGIAALVAGVISWKKYYSGD